MRPVARAPSLISAAFPVVSAPLVMNQESKRPECWTGCTSGLSFVVFFFFECVGVCLLGYLVAFLADAAVANMGQVRSHNSQLGSLEIWKYVFGAGSVSCTKNKTCETQCLSEQVFGPCGVAVAVGVCKSFILQTHWKTISVFIRHLWRGTVSTIQFELYLDHEDSMIEDANKCKQ